MCARRYYSQRSGKGSNLTLKRLKRVFTAIVLSFKDRGYLQEYFGYECVDQGFVAGHLGTQVSAFLLQELRFDAWPIDVHIEDFTEADLFDVIEFLFDHVSKPVNGREHTYAECGWHYETFDRRSGRDEFRNTINKHLRDYENGFELSTAGEILTLVDPGSDTLFSADLPLYDSSNVEKRVQDAVMKFRRSRSSLSERRDAVRDLADVLEFLRPQAKKLLTSKDESDLFQIANRFGIRHHNAGQQTDYDQAIWLSWMFYHYLATIHALVRLIKKHQES